MNAMIVFFHNDKVVKIANCSYKSSYLSFGQFFSHVGWRSVHKTDDESELPPLRDVSVEGKLEKEKTSTIISQKSWQLQFPEELFYFTFENRK